MGEETKGSPPTTFDAIQGLLDALPSEPATLTSAEAAATPDI